MERVSKGEAGEGNSSPALIWGRGMKVLEAVGLVLILCLFFGTVVLASDLEKIQRLNLVYKGFRLGTELERAKGLRPLKGALPGTLRFKDGSLVVAVDEKTRHIIALYEEYPQITPQELQRVVGELMGRLGEPTFEAHDKMLFWYFSPKGKISSETFNRIVEKGEEPKILAIVKLYCDHKIVEFANQKDPKARAKVYVTFYSPLLIRKIMQAWL